MNVQKFLSGRNALITGAGRGIGLAVAQQLAALGARVILVGRTQQQLELAKEKIVAAGGEATIFCANVTQHDCLHGLLKKEESVSVLVHAAAAYAPYGPLEECSERQVAEVVETNLTAALYLSAALLPGMKRDHFGMLLFIGSKVASLGGANQVAYASAKAGLVGLVKSLAVEGARFGVNAHLLELGLFDTERITEAMSPAAKQQLVQAIPIQRIGLPHEVASAVRYLTSPEAAYLRGVVLPIDGGLGLGLPKRHRVDSSL